MCRGNFWIRLGSNEACTVGQLSGNMGTNSAGFLSSKMSFGKPRFGGELPAIAFAEVGVVSAKVRPAWVFLYLCSASASPGILPPVASHILRSLVLGLGVRELFDGPD
eukprot:160584-Amphidinium_carterae.1